MKTFITYDGYRFKLRDGWWTDGDLAFEDVNGHPVDCDGKHLLGRLEDEPDPDS